MYSKGDTMFKIKIIFKVFLLAGMMVGVGCGKVRASKIKGSDKSSSVGSNTSGYNYDDDINDNPYDDDGSINGGGSTNGDTNGSTNASASGGTNGFVNGGTIGGNSTNGGSTTGGNSTNGGSTMAGNNIGGSNGSATNGGTTNGGSTMAGGGTNGSSTGGSTNGDEYVEVPTRACNVTQLRANLQASFSGSRASSAPLVDYTYCMFYGRNYDPSGRGYWRVETSDSVGLGLDAVYTALYMLPEFRSAIGNLSNSAYMDLLYRRILNRQPDSGGLKFWVDQLNAGTHSRETAYLSFLKSNEFQAMFNSKGPHMNDRVLFLYSRVLNLTTAQALNDERAGYYIAKVDVNRNGGISTKMMMIQFAAADEFGELFLTKNKSYTAKGMVRLAYKFFLQREPEQAGLDYWMKHLRSKAGNKPYYSQEEFVQHLARYFVEQPEFLNNNPWYNNSKSRY